MTYTPRSIAHCAVLLCSIASGIYAQAPAAPSALAPAASPNAARAFLRDMFKTSQQAAEQQQWLLGTWTDGRGTVEFRASGTCHVVTPAQDIGDVTYRVDGNRVTLQQIGVLELRNGILVGSDVQLRKEEPNTTVPRVAADAPEQTHAAEVIPPTPDRYFNDYVSVVSKEAALRFNEQLAQFERETSNQVVVAVFPKMQSDLDITDYTQRVAQAWGVGQKERRNGVVLFMFVQDRKMFIQVGYGLEGALPDATAFDITEYKIKPHFRNGDYEGGIAAGIDSIFKATRGEYKGSGKTVAEEHRGGGGANAKPRTQSQDDVSTVYVGGTPILLPTPKGYYRIDGKNEKIDAILRASVGKNVRPLAWFGSKVALAETISGKMSPDQGVSFQALTGTLIENVTVSPSKFQSLKQDVIKDSKAFVEGFDKDYGETAGSEAMSLLLGKAASLRIGETIPLGVFDESPDSVSYSFLMKLNSVSADGKSKLTSIFVSAQSHVLLRGRLIQLGCSTNYHNPSDISLVRDLLKQWKDSVVQLATRPVEPPSSELKANPKDVNLPPEAAVPPPPWDQIKASPEYQQLKPDQQLAVFSQWRTDSVRYLSQQPGFDSSQLPEFNRAAAPEMQRLSDAASQYYTGHHSSLYEHRQSARGSGKTLAEEHRDQPPVTKEVGGVAVPPPADMVEVSDYSDHFRRLASAFPEKPFGLYYLLSEFKDIDNGARTLASRNAVGSINFQSASESDARARFNRETGDGEKEFARMKFSSAEFQEALQSGLRGVSANFPALKIGISGMSVLDVDFSRPNRKTVVALVNSSLAQQGVKSEFTLVLCMGWQLVGRTSLNLIYQMPLTDASTPTAARKALEAWMDAIEAKKSSEMKRPSAQAAPGTPPAISGEYSQELSEIVSEQYDIRSDGTYYYKMIYRKREPMFKASGTYTIQGSKLLLTQTSEISYTPNPGENPPSETGRSTEIKHYTLGIEENGDLTIGEGRFSRVVK